MNIFYVFRPARCVSNLRFVKTVAFFLAGLFFLIGSASSLRAQNTDTAKTPLQWWKGNTHTHSHWSDGDDYPEAVAAWYKEHGYNFLALTDHNILADPIKWIDPAKTRGGMAAYEKYLRQFGPDWVRHRTEDGTTLVQLKTLREYRHLFEEPGRFLLIPGEEITDNMQGNQVHLNVTNIRTLIPATGGDSLFELMQNHVKTMLAQKEDSGQQMLIHLCHPNFFLALPRWLPMAMQAEDIAAVEGLRFFEVYNGHKAVYNEGKGQYISTDRMWDIILTKRLTDGTDELLYGIAGDDAHDYHEFSEANCNPGRGWVVVRSTFLTPESIVTAMDRGDFYASTGVTLKNIRFDSHSLEIDIDAKPGVSYNTEFVGTRKGYDPTSQPLRDENGQEIRGTRIYSDSIGQVLAKVQGPSAAYTLTGDEIYVRARVTSSEPQDNGIHEKDMETAWCQPIVPVVEMINR